MSNCGVQQDDLLATGRPGAFLDPQVQRCEPQLGVAGEGEQCLDGWQPGGQPGEFGSRPAVDPNGKGSGAVPEVRLQHRPDCSLPKPLDEIQPGAGAAETT